jgi:hypothetical protein
MVAVVQPPFFKTNYKKYTFQPLLKHLFVNPTKTTFLNLSSIHY